MSLPASSAHKLELGHRSTTDEETWSEDDVDGRSGAASRVGGGAIAPSPLSSAAQRPRSRVSKAGGGPPLSSSAAYSNAHRARSRNWAQRHNGEDEDVHAPFTFDTESGSDADEYEGGFDAEADERQGNAYHRDDDDQSQLDMPRSRRRGHMFKLPRSIAPFDISARYISPSASLHDANGTSPPRDDDVASVASDLSPEERERFEWQNMLSNVLTGDVLIEQKKQMTKDPRELSGRDKRDRTIMKQLYLGLRAYLRGRTVEEETSYLEEARLHIDPILEEVKNFALPEGMDREAALDAVGLLLSKVDWCENLFPSLRAMTEERPKWAEEVAVKKLEVLRSWEGTTRKIRVIISILQKLTGNDDLDVSRPSELVKADVEDMSTRSPSRSQTQNRTGARKQILDSSTFVERLLQDGSVERLFQNKTFHNMHALVNSAKQVMITLSTTFDQLHLPLFTDDLIAIAAFAPSLMHEVLRLRLQNARLLKNDLSSASPVLRQQLTDDFRTSLLHATAVKKAWMMLIKPEPGWEMPQPEAAKLAYDEMLANVLRFFFRLLDTHILAGANKSLDAKDTEIVEGEWTFLKEAVSEIDGGDVLLGEHYSTLTHRLMSRVHHFFDANLTMLEKRLSSRDLDVKDVARWYDFILASLRQRHRKVLRFSRTILGRFENSAEYVLDKTVVDLSLFVNGLTDTQHFLVYTGSFEREGIYLVGSPSLHSRPDLVADILLQCFHIHTQPDYEPVRRTRKEASETPVNGHGEGLDQEVMMVDGVDLTGYPHYLLVLSPRDPFMWTGAVMNLDLPHVDLDVRDHRVRIIADGPGEHLQFAKSVFLSVFPAFKTLTVVDQKAHLFRVNREVKKIKRASYRLSERVIKAADQVISACQDVPDSQPILAAYFNFAAEWSERSMRYMEKAIREKYTALLIQFGIKWITFVSDDCRTDDPKTFRAAVNALEFLMEKTKGDYILGLDEEEFGRLRAKVASCMSLLISHFDVLGARYKAEQKQQKERLEMQREELRWRLEFRMSEIEAGRLAKIEWNETGKTSGLNSSIRAIRTRWTERIEAIEQRREDVADGEGFKGNELDHQGAEDAGLLFLAASANNISIRWQQGRFVGAGSFGSVYLALNLDTGDPMAVKEIRLQELSSSTRLVDQIRDEMHIMSLLHHDHIVDYFGIEVHRDKVYIFEEFCEGGSLAEMLEHGRVNEEMMSQAYTYQLLSGLSYLHANNVVHRDIKPDNILLDRLGNLKYVDFGAAKMLAKETKTMAARTRAMKVQGMDRPGAGGAEGEDRGNSLTGTPMYLSPEVIKGENKGRRGAMDVWSLGCVVLEMVTGRRPWSNLDNEWAIMFHIGIATKHPPLPDASELSEIGIDFIRLSLTLDPTERPTAEELLQHAWMLDYVAAVEAASTEGEEWQGSSGGGRAVGLAAVGEAEEDE